MSGSPIIQDNMLIGAITHVNVDNVISGYALYMQYMYQMSLQKQTITDNNITFLYKKRLHSYKNKRFFYFFI